MTEPQHVLALQKANKHRGDRAKLRREVAALKANEGKARLAELLEDPPPEMVTAQIGEALLWVRRVGPGRVPPLLRSAGLSHARHVGSLTPRQRSVLTSWLRGEQ